MSLSYIPFEQIPPEDFLVVLNSAKVRAHLIDHPVFTLETVSSWMRSKIDVDNTPGCRVRAVMQDGKLIGWCAIQCEAGQYELAIVIDESSWGVGKQIFHEMMGWARTFHHSVVYIHFLHTRPQYRFLTKLAKSVTEISMLGARFTRYELEVV